MGTEVIAVFFFILAIVLLVLGVHIGLALGLAGTLGILVVTGSFTGVLGLLKTTPYHSTAAYAFTVVPLFILMGMFSLYGGISEAAYKAVGNWVGGLRGGLAIATTWACAGFGATSGSYIAAGTVFTKISLPEMRKAGYDLNFACGGIATAAIIAMIIPPSLFLVIYGMITETSIARMLIAGVLPGILMATTLSIGMFLVALRNPKLAPPSTMSVSWKERMVSTGTAWPMVVLAAIIIGGIYAGVFTPTEASAVGAFVALVICLGYRKLNWDRIRGSLIETAYTTALLMFVIIGATIFARFLTISGLTIWLGNLISSAGLSSLHFLIIVTVLFLILGCFIDPLSIMFITMPIFFPVVQSLGINPIWFGLLTCVALVLGAITPPFGLSVYTVKAAAGPDVTVEGVFRGAFPTYFPMIATLVLLIAFPQISLFLPNTMLK